MNWREVLDGMTARLARAAFGAAAAPAPAADPVWHALPGSRLELGNTGFYIDLVTKPGGFTHLLYSPEGALCAHCIHLTPLKRYAEQLAGERAEFAPPAPIPLNFRK